MHETSQPTAPVRLCLLSYRHLSRLALGVIGEFADRTRIEVIDAAFDSALAAAHERERAGTVDAFVSAGSNAAILRGAVTRPVATIQADGYDLLHALLQARRHGGRIGVVTYEDTIAELEAVKALLNIDVEQRAYRSPEQARECFRALASAGVNVIVGSSIAVEMAEREGLHGVLGYSPASVRRGIAAAIELARVARLEAARSQQLQGVLRNLQEAVLAVDAQHRITAVNAAMEQVLGRSARALQGLALDEVDPRLGLLDTLRHGHEGRAEVLQLDGRDWVVNRNPIRDGDAITGAVIALYDGEAIQAADSSLRSQLKRRKAGGVRYRFADHDGRSPAIVRARESARRFARTDLTVLIRGESGTGKERFAQAIHAASARAAGPFIAIDCSALPETLLESELFGHEEGAFTGARRGGRQGLFEAARGGTVFLDEIGDMPVQLQTRLLRVLQEREVSRLGGGAPVPVDVRVIAASHQPLDDLIAAGRFRADLYYRLNVLRLALPALRERGEDIEGLALGMVADSLARLGSRVAADEVLALLAERLRAYAWPGNLRELQNICERIAVFFAQYARAAEADLGLLAADCPELFAARQTVPGLSPSEEARRTLDACGGNRNEAARRLGISRATLWRRLRAAQPVATRAVRPELVEGQG